MSPIPHPDPVPRLRRSALYLPAVNQRALDKAMGLDADVLILDLEDAVAPARKAEARERLRAQLDRVSYAPRECIVRVNGLHTPWCDDDLAALAGTAIDGILFPKVNRADDVAEMAARMGAAGLPATMPLWIMAETAVGIAHIVEICEASPAPACVVLGTSDLARELRLPQTPGRLGFLYLLSGCVVAARAAGADVLDGVHLDLSDTRGLVQACEQGRNLGFDGKTLIHPDQLAAANAAFAPTASALQRAQRILAAWAEEPDAGVLVVDGMLVEELHVREARHVVALHEEIARREAAGGGS